MSPRRILRPQRPALASWWAVLLAAGLVAFGVVLILDAASRWNWIAQPTRLSHLVGYIHGLTPTENLLTACFLLCFLGIALIFAAFARRRPTAYQIDAAGEMWLRFSGAEVIAQSVVQDVEGVLSARASANPRRIDVTVVATDADKATVKRQATERITQALAPLDGAPKVIVRVSK